MASNPYNAFHGHGPRSVTRYDMHQPRQLIILGRATAIEYESDKVHGGGDGKKNVFRHKFAPGTILAMDERAKGQLYIIGKRLKVTSAGIEN
jgi:hypothetical protein